MKRSSRTNRQIKRNINGLLSRQKKESVYAPADAAFHVLAAFVAILLPLSLVALAGNAILRVPDLMAFEADRSGVPAELGIEGTPSAVAEEITGFINHKNDEPDIPALSGADKVNLIKIRALLDKSLFPSLLSFTVSIALFVFVRAMGRRRYLRVALNTSLALFACAVCFTLALALIPPFRDAVFAWQPGIGFEEGDVLPRLFGGLYPIFSAGAICLISFIIYITLYSFLKRFTVEEEKMFK